jgi:regulator of PEP synthase PpsR (kinase-PPPase family)
MAESRLLELRRTRASAITLPQSNYISPEYVRNELSYAKKLCRDHDWQLIDTTGKSIEEIAREILALMPASEKKSLPD